MPRPRFPRLRFRNNLFVLAFLGLALGAGLSPARAAATKEAVLAKYEQAVALTEELNVLRRDVLDVVPRIELAMRALLRGDVPHADEMLDQVLNDLQLLQAKKPGRLQAAFRSEWVEIYAEVFQKFAFLALLAYFFVKIPYFGRLLRKDNLSLMAKVYLVFLTGLGAVLMSVFDLSRYGRSTWAFFDIQVVLLAIGGILGGFWAGAVSGLVVGIFRWVLDPTAPVYFAVALAAGALAGFLSRGIRSFQKAGKNAFLIGVAVGLVHGLAVYFTMFRMLPLPYLVLSVGFLAALEGFAVFLFFAVISGLLRESVRHEVEQELLKTKLLFLQAQINPHFLYNALNTISAICSREGAEQAQHLTLRLADFLRATVKRMEQDVTLREEMSHLDAYLEIERARFQERLRIEKNITIPEEYWQTRIPFLSLQPLVENAIKHGIGKKPEGGTVKIEIGASGGVLKAEVADDGVGMTEQTLLEIKQGRSVSREGGIGVTNVHQRLVRSFGPAHGLRFESASGEGTRVSFTVPVRAEAKK